MGFGPLGKLSFVTSTPWPDSRPYDWVNAVAERSNRPRSNHHITIRISPARAA